MKQAKIKVGDFVKTNLENSPVMKIEKIVKLKALCYWFDKNHAINNQLFMLSDLTVVKEGVIDVKNKKK